ncbi:hypothetical protein [Leptospira santarosai]|uniref:hypothetical protein n=1 Tax=Leptospira santarosai TaxID=28183 RepID=UPI000374D597|nr:hypothetical protein [Leptospira santarosai]OLY62080.1 hypothetical protein BV917_00480 [Leptospira santarosai serovar Guaricura]MBW9231380.1 hypothetical protein [Leptospira santarosai]MDI7166922.1 hypothetical protein [Leptospira santarosai]MDI7174682.1 hypothetical protein [Leptospira santarosai]MDI7194419.1 hypothetical protein [Leptospira santarosai]
MNRYINILRRLERGFPVAILIVGFWGLMTDEPYLRAVGHEISIFDFTNWFLILTDGPASLISYIFASLVTHLVFKPYLESPGSLILQDFDFHFMIYYTSWSILSVFQWKSMIWLLKEGRLHGIVKKIFLSVIGICTILSIWAFFTTLPEFYSDEHQEFYLPVRMFACAILFLVTILMINKGTVDIQK